MKSAKILRQETIAAYKWSSTTIHSPEFNQFKQQYQGDCLEDIIPESAVYVRFGEYPTKSECADLLADLGPDFYLVMDGMGPNGRQAIWEICDYWVSFFECNKEQFNINDPEQIKQLLLKLASIGEKRLKTSKVADYSLSGLCVNSIFIRAGVAYCMNLGNCRAVLHKQLQDQYIAIDISRDHTLDLQEEYDRIEAAGGTIDKLQVNQVPVGKDRVWIDKTFGVVATRCLGSFKGKKLGLSADVEITTIDLNDDDQFIILASDGVWNVMSSIEACQFVVQHKFRKSVAEALIQECKMKWDTLNKEGKSVGITGDYCSDAVHIDDMVVQVVYLRPEFN